MVDPKCPWPHGHGSGRIASPREAIEHGRGSGRIASPRAAGRGRGEAAGEGRRYPRRRRASRSAYLAGDDTPLSAK